MPKELVPEWMPFNPYPTWQTCEQNLAYAEAVRDTARKVFVWLNSDCVESHSDGFNRTRKDCKFCMQEYCKEVGA
jgi:hypothetical protein